MTPQERIAKAIKATGNPLAPVVIERALSAVEALGPMMVGSILDKQMVVKKTIEMLCQGYTDEELNEISSSPEFIVALSGMLSASIKGYIAKLGEDQ